MKAIALGNVWRWRLLAKSENMVLFNSAKASLKPERRRLRLVEANRAALMVAASRGQEAGR